MPPSRGTRCLSLAQVWATTHAYTIAHRLKEVRDSYMPKLGKLAHHGLLSAAFYKPLGGLCLTT